MFTAKIQSKEIINGAIRVYVEFADDKTSIVESCIPQDENGLKFWIKSRLTTFNSAETIDTKYSVDATVDVSEPVVVTPTPTAAEIARDAWLANYRTWIKVKTTLIDTGILTGNETKLVNLKNKVTSDFLPAYIDLI